MRGFVVSIVAAFALGVGVAEARAPTLHYVIDASLAPAQGMVTADVRVRGIAVHGQGQARFLLGGGFRVDRFSASGGATITVVPPQGPGAPQMLLVSCGSCGPRQRTDLHLAYSGIVEDGDHTNIVSPTRAEFSADSLWYPISVNFNTRVTFELRLDGLPRDFVIASADEVVRAHNSFVVTRSQPHADIAFMGLAHPAVRDDGELHFYAANFNSPLSQRYLQNGPRALAFLEHLYGSLPTRRAVVAIAQRESGIGYSRAGYVAVADASRPELADDEWASKGYLAHELSHAWWSNADFTGEDYWLVESTAEYSALRFIEFIDGRDARDRILTAKQPRFDRAGPILGHGRPSNDAVYAKGPILLFRLEDRIGRSTLERILRLLARRDAITTRDFLDALRDAAGSEVALQFESDLNR